MADTAPRRTGATRSEGPAGWHPLALALVCTAAYGVFLLLPYYANHLNEFPLEEVAAGNHDPKDLWPRDTTLGGIVFGVGGAMTVLLGPGVELAALTWALLWLWRDRRARWRTRGTSLAAAVLALGTIIWLATPFGAALMTWWFD